VYGNAQWHNQVRRRAIKLKMLRIYSFFLPHEKVKRWYDYQYTAEDMERIRWQFGF
jgi:hypothetical protein